MCVCEREREIERERGLCVWCERVYVRERLRERLCVRERVCERERVTHTHTHTHTHKQNLIKALVQPQKNNSVYSPL